MPDRQLQQPTILTAGDAYLKGKSSFDEWQKGFETAWYKPIGEIMARFMWSRQPEQVKNYIRQSKPEAAKAMDELIGKEG